MVHAYLTSAGGSVSFETESTGGTFFQFVFFGGLVKAGVLRDGGMVVSSDVIPLFEERCEDKRGLLSEDAACRLVDEWFNLMLFED